MAIDYVPKIAQYYFYPTMECSLSCNHCFIDERIRKSKMSMTVEQFKRVVDEFAKHFHESNVPIAEITIMGGEPTLLKPDFFEEVIPYVKEKFKAEGKFNYITLMTNFLHLASMEKTHQLFDFVSTSYEPNRWSELNNVNGIDKKYATWEKNMRYWIDSGRIVTLSLTTTDDVLSQGTELLDKFYDMGVRYFQINKAYPEGEYLKNLLPQEQFQAHQESRESELMKPARKRRVIEIVDSKDLFADFEKESQYFIDVTQWMMKKLNSGEFVNVDPLSGYAEGLKDNTEIEDVACGSGKGFSARGDGVVTGCAAEIGNMNAVSFGNIWEQDIEEITHSKVRADFLNSQKRVRASCIKCEFFHQCKGGCILRSRLWDEKSGQECHGNITYIKYVQENLAELHDVMSKANEMRQDWAEAQS